MKTEQLEEFVVFAKHLNFSKAAKDLYITQPALSNHIAGLERELGFKLVKRGKQIALTPAGRRFFIWAEKTLASYERILEKCRQVSSMGELSLVFEKPVETADIIRLYETLLFRFTLECPYVTLRQQTSAGMTLFDILDQGKADIGVVFDQSVVTDDSRYADKFVCLPLSGEVEQARYVWLHKDHPLNQLKSVRTMDLDGSKLLVPADMRYEVYELFVRRMGKENGIELDIVHGPGSRTECVLSINDDEIEILSSAEMNDPLYNAIEGRCFRKLDAFPTWFQPCFIYHRENENPALEIFRNFVFDSV